MPWGQIAAAAITAGASFLANRGSDEEQPMGINYRKLARDAEKGGFNPLTALRAGGGAAYQRTSSPVLASSAVIGNALMDGFNAFMSYEDQTEINSIEKDLARAQLAKVQAETSAINVGMVRFGQSDIPTMSGPTMVRTGTSFAPVNSHGWEIGKPTITNPYPFGLKIDTNTVDAETMATRYGDSELFQTLYGGYVVIKDFIANSEKMNFNNIVTFLNGGQSPVTVKKGGIADWWMNNWDKPLFPDISPETFGFGNENATVRRKFQ